MAVDRVKAETFFQSLSYPADRSAVRKFAAENGADSELKARLGKIGDKSYGTAHEIGMALDETGEVSGPKPRSLI